jgi:hypothetical protein
MDHKKSIEKIAKAFAKFKFRRLGKHFIKRDYDEILVM